MSYSSFLCQNNVRKSRRQLFAVVLLFSMASHVFVGSHVVMAAAKSSVTAPSDVAENHFGDGWNPKPLRDLSAPVAQPVAEAPVKSVKPVVKQPTREEIDARLAPYEPFIHEVEGTLSLQPAKGSSRVQRLNAIQEAVFTEQAYKGDAGELITRLQAIFPEQAARAALKAPASKPQIVSSTPALSEAAKPPREKRQKAPRKQKATADDPFANDPFFNDDTMDMKGFGSDGSQSASAQPSRLKSAAAGLGALAVVGAAVAGSAYLSKGSKTSNYYDYPYQPGYGNGYGNYAPGYAAYPGNLHYANNNNGLNPSIARNFPYVNINPYNVNPYYGATPYGYAPPTRSRDNWANVLGSALGVPTGYGAYPNQAYGYPSYPMQSYSNGLSTLGGFNTINTNRFSTVGY